MVMLHATAQGLSRNHFDHDRSKAHCGLACLDFSAATQMVLSIVRARQALLKKIPGKALGVRGQWSPFRMGAQAPVKLGVRGQWSPSDGRPGPREACGAGAVEPFRWAPRPP